MLIDERVNNAPDIWAKLDARRTCAGIPRRTAIECSGRGQDRFGRDKAVVAGELSE